MALIDHVGLVQTQARGPKSVLAKFIKFVVTKNFKFWELELKHKPSHLRAFCVLYIFLPFLFIFPIPPHPPVPKVTGDSEFKNRGLMNNELNSCFICDKKGEPQEVFIHVLLSHRLLQIFLNEKYL